MEKSSKPDPLIIHKKMYLDKKEFYACGDHSILFLVNMEPDYPFKFIVKRISISELERMYELIISEIENAELYKSTNCIIKYYGCLRSKEHIYLIYDFFDSYTLSQLMVEGHSKIEKYEDKLNLALNISKKLKQLHDHKLMHRNLNPSHILVSKDLKNILFCGVKSIYNFADCYPSQMIGCDPYMAPEIHQAEIMAEHYNEKVDIYSLGVIIFQLFAKICRLTNELPDNIDSIGGISIGIKKLIHDCLMIDPKKRISSSLLINDKYYIQEEVKQIKIHQILNPIIPPIFDLQIFNINIKDSLQPYKKTGFKFGEGTYGKVIEVENTETNTKYAMKIIRIGRLNDPHEADLVIGEVNLLNTLKDISFMITLIDAFYYRSNLCIVLEICNGGDLNKAVKNPKNSNFRLNIEDVKIIAWNLAEGLFEMHKRKIVHRDLKPANILLITDSNNRITDAKICDLGIARKLRENFPEFHTEAGTEAYMAPEFRRKLFDTRIKLTEKVDVFSYGLILYFMVYGNDAVHLQKEKKYEFSQGIIFFPEENKINASPEILELMRKCLDPNPETRISFAEIIKSPFFSKLEIPNLSDKYQFNENKFIYNGALNLGLIDSSKQYWVKLYKAAAVTFKHHLKYIEREINFLNISKSVPHIVQIVDFGWYQSSIALIFKNCNGGNLYKLFIKRRSFLNLDPSKVFEIDEIKLVARCLIEFIDGMQGKNYVHRAINPSHVLVETDASQKIMDVKICGFRSSKSENQSAEVTFVVDSNYKYFDPTAIEEGYSEESDLWSIGLVIYFMSTGQEPMNNLEESKNIRKSGKINFPQHIDLQIKKFIEFCIKPRIRGSMYTKVLFEEIKKEGILI